MSVWPVKLSPEPSLSGREGALVSVSISVEPRHLESLLEALAQMSFPINPQICHDATVVYRYADQHEEVETVTLVEFPAYSNQLEEVGRVLTAHGFDRSAIEVTSMLEEIQSASAVEVDAAPVGASEAQQRRVKTRSASGD